MKIAIDIDKTYTADPELFGRIARRFQMAGHKVGVLTARSKSEGGVSTFNPDFEFYLDCGQLTYVVRAQLKAQTMRDNGIDILFDDRDYLFPEDVVVIKII